MSDELPAGGRAAPRPGGRACRSTSTAPGCSSRAFVAWTGWRHGRDLGTGGALAYAAWHRRRHPRRRARPRGRPRAWRPGCSGSGCTASSRRCGAGTRPTTATGTTPGRHGGHRGAPGPLANLALAAVGAARWLPSCRGRHREFALAVHVPQPAARRLQPAARAPARRRPARAVARLGRQRPPRPRPRRRRLVRPAARRRASSLWYVGQPARRGQPGPVRHRPRRWSWPGSSGRGATAAIRRAPLERLLAAGASRGRHRPGRRGAGRSPRSASSWASAARVVALDERGPADPAPARAVRRPRPTSPPSARAPGWRRSSSSCPTTCVVELAPGADAEPVLRAMATTGLGRRRRDLGAGRCAASSPPSGSTPWPRPCSAATRLRRHDP